MMNVAQKQISVTVNGERREVPGGLTVEGLLTFLGIDPERVAIELNRDLCRRPAWPTTIIADGAQLEIVMFVGGG